MQCLQDPIREANAKRMTALEYRDPEIPVDIPGTIDERYLASEIV